LDGHLFHAVPFQRRIRLWRSLTWPTAQAFLADVAATTPVRRMLIAPAGMGLRTRCHALPFQCRTRVLRNLIWPTAQAFLADVAATWDSRP